MVLDQSLYRFELREPSYWEATVDRPAGQTLKAAIRTDVAIIGGGYTGTSAALHLARGYGIGAVVLDAGTVGWGASGRNGGFVNIPASELSVAQLVRRYGLEETQRCFAASVEASKMPKQLAAEEGFDIRPQGRGRFTVFERACQGWSNEAPVISTRSLAYYYRLLPNRRVLFGARGDVSGGPHAMDSIRRRMCSEFARIFPALSQVTFDYFWRGVVALSQKLSPSIGRLEEDPSIYYALGYQANGVATAPYAGRLVADAIGRRCACTLVRQWRGCLQSLLCRVTDEACSPLPTPGIGLPIGGATDFETY